MVKEVTAYQVSDGRCFGDKREAYQEELVHLYHSLPQVAKRGFSLVQCSKLLSEVEGWLPRAREVHGSMVEAGELDLSIGFGKLLEHVEGWVLEVKELTGQMAAESDPEAKRDIRSR